MHTPFARPFAARTLASLLAILAVSAGAQPAAGQPDPQKAAQAAGAAKDDGSMLPTLRFPGGTVDEYIAAVQKASRVPFNIISHPSAAHITLPPISIDNAEPIYAFEAIDGMTSETDSGVWVVNVVLADSPYEGVSSVRAQFLAEPANLGATLGSTEVLDLSAIVKPEQAQGEGLRLDDVLAAVTTAVEQANSNVAPPAQIGSPTPPKSIALQPKIALHRETSLLFVTGTPDQIRAASQVIQRLTARGTSWSTMTEVVQRANEADREWFVSQLTVALRGVEGASITASDNDNSLVTVTTPGNAKLAVELLGRYLLSPEVQAQRTQRVLEEVIERTRLATRVESLTQELATSRQAHLGREAELRAENQRLRDQLEAARTQGK